MSSRFLRADEAHICAVDRERRAGKQDEGDDSLMADNTALSTVRKPPRTTSSIYNGKTLKEMCSTMRRTSTTRSSTAMAIRESPTFFKYLAAKFNDLNLKKAPGWIDRYGMTMIQEVMMLPTDEKTHKWLVRSTIGLSRRPASSAGLDYYSIG